VVDGWFVQWIGGDGRRGGCGDDAGASEASVGNAGPAGDGRCVAHPREPPGPRLRLSG